MISWIDQSSMKARSFFYVGGEITGAEGRRHMKDQMFVEGYLPKEQRHPYPLVFFHGAGQTNMNWLMTPDGRMGWADWFLQQGYCVYLAEQPARGRSGYHPEDHGSRIYHPLEDIQRRFTTDQGSWPQAKTHSQWPGDGSDWQDPVFRQFASAQVEYLPSNRDSQALVLAAGQELLKIIGPAILVTHSQAGPFGWLLADAVPELVRGIVTLEPSGPPFSTDLTGEAARNYGLAELPLHFEPPVASPEDFDLRILPGDGAYRCSGWVLQEGTRLLPRLAGKPVLILCAGASYHAQYDHLTSDLLHKCGVDHDMVFLPEVGIYGNGHFIMLEKNHLEVAAWVTGWLERQGL